MNDQDFVKLIEPVARRLWGSRTRRCRTAGSCVGVRVAAAVVDLKKGVWHDHETNEGGGNFDLIKRETGRSGRDAIAWLEDEGLIPKQNGGSGNGGTISASYDYRDEDNKLLFQVVRFEPKDFRQRRPDGNGGWTWKLGDARACSVPAFGV